MDDGERRVAQRDARGARHDDVALGNVILARDQDLRFRAPAQIGADVGLELVPVPPQLVPGAVQVPGEGHQVARRPALNDAEVLAVDNSIRSTYGGGNSSGSFNFGPAINQGAAGNANVVRLYLRINTLYMSLCVFVRTLLCVFACSSVFLHFQHYSAYTSRCTSPSPPVLCHHTIFRM